MADTEKYVTKKEFVVLEKGVNRILDLLEGQLTGSDEQKPETKEEKAVVAAGPNKYVTNPEWEEAAKEVLGDYLDHTEVLHEKTGGIMFTVVIDRDKSNASQSELASPNWTDRRTKEVGALGMDGVVEWCKLIRQNVSRNSK